MDVLYMTRVQQERFAQVEDYLRLKDVYILDGAKMALAKPDMIVLHPLPRVNEIAPEVDDDPRAVYFQQALFGKFVRMALILMLLDEAQARPGTNKAVLPAPSADKVCRNPRCITTAEQGILQYFHQNEQGQCRCFWCEHRYKAAK